MGSVDHLRRQHGELLRLAREIVPLLDVERLAPGFTALRLKLSAFVRKVGVHLALEDRFIYGRLTRHSDPTIAGKATTHQNETNQLRERVAQFADQWISHGAGMESDPASFIDEAKTIFDLVAKKCDLEDREIYPLVDRICSPSGSWPLDLVSEVDETLEAG
jgi:hemerythrin-like domain-containing protein